MSKENIEKAKEAKSVEELLALAKENDYPLTEEEAQNYFNQFHATGELSDDELDQVGGGCGGSGEYTPDGYLKITGHDLCSRYICKSCGRPSISSEHLCIDGKTYGNFCINCSESVWDSGNNYCRIRRKN